MCLHVYLDGGGGRGRGESERETEKEVQNGLNAHKHGTQTVHTDRGYEALDPVWVASVNSMWDEALAGNSLHK